MADYELVTRWVLEAPVTRVWEVLRAVEEWPLWWRGVVEARLVSPGDALGVGALHRYTWRSRLPYDLSFEMRTTRVVPMEQIAGEASGELVGHGLWTFQADGDRTRLRYDWRVDVSKPWMRWFAPLLRPIFVWNHDVIMAWGQQGLTERVKEG